MRRSHLALGALLYGLSGCGGAGDGPIDAASADASGMEEVDAGTAEDAGTPDAGPRGCLDDHECGLSQVCDRQAGACLCEPGTHRCGSACVPDQSVETCGSRCTPCPSPEGGLVTCEEGRCGFTCELGRLACGSVCAVCPEDAAALACEGQRCVATSCEDGLVPCGGRCARCPTEDVITASCVADRCVATACADGSRPCETGCCPWTIETVLTRQRTTGLQRIAVDTAGDLHVAATDGSAAILYLHQTPSGREELSLSRAARSLALAPARTTPQIAFADEIADAHFAEYSGGRWSFGGFGTMIEGPDVALAVDPRGNTHACLWQDPDFPSTIRLVHWVRPLGGEWQLAPMADVGELGVGGCSVAGDAAGTPHISSRDADGSLVHVRLSGNRWSRTRVERQASVSGATSLAVDPAGAPHICFRSANDIRYARWRGSAWELETIARGDVCRLAIDRQGRVHLVFQEVGVRYWRRDGPNEPWRSSRITGQGGLPDIAIDAADEPRVVFGRGRDIQLAQ